MWRSEEIIPGVWAGFSDVTAGNLALHVGDGAEQVLRRRADVNAALASVTGGAVELAYMNQVHGCAVVRPGGAAGEAPTADAMVARSAAECEAGLAVMVADCVPVVLAGTAADGSPRLAVAHAGRPGVAAGVIGAVMAELADSGARNILAWLGPSVCGRCYEVPQEMRQRVAAVVPEAFATTSWGTPALDLPAAVAAQLGAAGATVRRSEVCTLEDPHWFSHRRAQRENAAEGRFIGFIAAGNNILNNDSASRPE